MRFLGLEHLTARRRGHEAGQGLAEYALIISIVAIASIVILVFIGSQVSTELSRIGNSV
jgi:Flp pilus assembly pilin Flp